MIELIQGEGGVIEATAEYVEGIAKLCLDKGLLLIFDEIQTGIGRTGKMFAYEHFGVEPDILTLAKGLGGGVPIGALLAKSHAAAFEPGDHGSTFGGNPLACTAALAVLKTLSEEDLIEQSAIKGAYFKDKLIYLKSLFPFIRDVRGKGLMLGLELDEKVNGKTIVEECFKAGFIINCAGKNTLRFVPPLIIKKEEIDALIAVLETIFSQVKEATQCMI
jgi:acetylornithine aminotransferase/acetylornithine/N-succinyldiaminopimelate aminotransferase